MKKFLICLLIIFSFTSCAVSFPIENHEMLVAAKKKVAKNSKKKSVVKSLSVNDFINRFNDAAVKLQLGHDLAKRDITSLPGKVNDGYMVKYADCLVLSFFANHDTKDFVQGYILYNGDSAGTYVADAMGLMAEIFYAAGAINKLSEAGEVFTCLDFKSLKNDDTHSLIKNNWKVYILQNSVVGIMAGVEKP